MLLTDTSLIFKGIKPLQRLNDVALGFNFSNPLSELLLAKNTPKRFETVPPDPWPGDSMRGRDMIAGVFSFVGQTIVKEELSWHPEKASPEWVAELHGFEWLRDLRSVGGERARRMAREMVAGWLRDYKEYNEITWRADIMGVRLKSWISFHDFFCASAGDEFRSEYFSSLARQAKHLSRAVNGSIYGIPLMRALRGLAYVGIALEDYDDYLEQAFDGVLEQIKEQILPDGGHISRSPQDTFEFLQCLVELRSALISAKIEVPEELQHAIDRITPAVKFFRYGDGGLAQFNGGQECDANLCEMILMHSGANGKAMKALPHSGYERISQGRSSVVMDTGVPLVSKYSKRAHTGALSFEYNFGRDRVFVNCGTSSVAGKWRRLLRSSQAHSALVVDDYNSYQFDSEGLLSNYPAVTSKRVEDNGVAFIDAAHSGYMSRFGLNHSRNIKLMERGEVLKGEEQLSGKSGVPFVIRFHLHPNIKASLIRNGQEVLLVAKSGASWRFKVDGAMLDLDESVYFSHGDTPRRSLQIVFTGQTSSATTVVNWEMLKENR